MGRKFFQKMDMNWDPEPGSAGILPARVGPLRRLARILPAPH